GRRGLVGRQVVQDDEQPVAVRAGGPDRLQRGQGVVGALTAPGHAPQLVIAQGVAAVEIPDAVAAVVGGTQPGRPFAPGPAGPVAGADRQRAELGEPEAAGRGPAGHVLDPVPPGVLFRVGGLLPGPGPLEADPAGVQQLPQPFPPDPRAGPGQVIGQLAQAPAGERQAQRLWPGGGRRDDHLDVVVTDPAGTAARP